MYDEVNHPVNVLIYCNPKVQWVGLSHHFDRKYLTFLIKGANEVGEKERKEWSNGRTRRTREKEVEGEQEQEKKGEQQQEEEEEEKKKKKKKQRRLD